MKTLSKLAWASVVFQILAATSALSLPLSGLSRPMETMDRYFISEKQRTVAPFAHVVFCMKSPVECQVSASEKIVALTSERRRQLAQVNDRVNRAIIGQTDQDRDTWSVSPASGDCEDYAITKRHQLIVQGWPPAALRLAIGRTSWGEGHLVLVVRTDKGDMVLNNLSNRVVNWRSSGLHWEMIQSSDDPRSWFRV